MSTSSIIAAANARAAEARGAQARSVTGQKDTTTAAGRAVQVALASNRTQSTIITRSIGALSAARSDLLAALQLVTELVSLNNRQAQIAVDQERALSAVGGGAANPQLTAEFNAIETQKAALVNNFQGNIQGLVIEPGVGSKDVTITLADGSSLQFAVQGLSAAGLREAADVTGAAIAAGGQVAAIAADPTANAANANAKAAAQAAALLPAATRATVSNAVLADAADRVRAATLMNTYVAAVNAVAAAAAGGWAGAATPAAVMALVDADGAVAAAKADINAEAGNAGDLARTRIAQYDATITGAANANAARTAATAAAAGANGSAAVLAEQAAEIAAQTDIVNNGRAVALAKVLFAPNAAPTIYDAAGVPQSKLAVDAAKVTLHKLSAELGSRLEAIGAALGKVENVISDQEQLVGSIEANSADIGAADQLADTQLQNTAKAAEKAAAFAIAQAMQQIADIMSILNR